MSITAPLPRQDAASFLPTSDGAGAPAHTGSATTTRRAQRPSWMGDTQVTQQEAVPCTAASAARGPGTTQTPRGLAQVPAVGQVGDTQARRAQRPGHPGRRVHRTAPHDRAAPRKTARATPGSTGRDGKAQPGTDPPAPPQAQVLTGK